MINIKLVKNTLKRIKINIIGLAVLSIFILSFFINLQITGKANIAGAIIANPFLCFLIPTILAISLFYFMFLKTANNFYNQAPISKTVLLNTEITVGIIVITCFSIIFYLFGTIMNQEIIYNFITLIKSLILQIIIFLTITLIMNNCKNIFALFLSSLVLFLALPYTLITISSAYFLNAFEVIGQLIFEVYFSHYVEELKNQSMFEFILSILTIIIFYYLTLQTVNKRKFDANTTPFYFKKYCYFIWFTLTFSAMLIGISLFNYAYNTNDTYLYVSIKRIITMLIVGTTIFEILNLIFYKKIFKKYKIYIIFILFTISIFFILENLENKTTKFIKENKNIYTDGFYYVESNTNEYQTYFNSIKGTKETIKFNDFGSPNLVLINSEKTKQNILNNLKKQLKNAGIFTFANEVINGGNIFFTGYNNNPQDYYNTALFLETKNDSKFYNIKPNYLEYSSEIVPDQMLGIYEKTTSIIAKDRDISETELIINEQIFKDLEKFTIDSNSNIRNQYSFEGKDTAYYGGFEESGYLVYVKVNDINLVFNLNKKSYEQLLKYKK